MRVRDRAADDRGDRARGRRRRAALAALLLLATSAAACSGDDGGNAGATASSGGLTVGGLDAVAPTVPGDRITDQAFVDFDGAEGTFARFAGTPMVVNFWASWCVPCITEMPDFEAVHRELAGRVTFVGVNVQDREQEGRAMAQRTGVSYELVRDPQGDLLAWIGGAGMPTTAFVDSNGTVRDVVSKQISPDDLRARIAELR